MAPSGASATAAFSAGDALLQILSRQRWLVVACCAACVVIAAAYLVIATPMYVGSARIYVQPAGPQVMGDGKSQLIQTSSLNFLNTQRELIRSTPILVLALAKPEVSQLQTFSGVKDRFKHLKDHLGVEVGRSDDLITVSFDSPHAHDASIVANGVVTAFMEEQARQRAKTATDVMQILQKEKTQCDFDLVVKTKGMLDFRRSRGVLSFDNEKTNITLQRLTSLSDALTNANLETFSAKAAYEESVASLGTDPARLAHLEQARKRGGPTVSSAAEEAQLRQELFLWQSRLDEMGQSYGPNHPAFQSLRRRVESLRVSYVAALGRRYAAAQQREKDLQQSFEAQQTEAITRSADAAEYLRLESEVQRIEKLAQTIETRIKEIQLTESAGAMNIVPVEWADVPRSPDRPRKGRSLAIALVLGLLFGVGLACLRDWGDPRLRSAEDIKAVLGAPVLGQLPRMPRDLAPSVRGQKVLLEPAGAVAEACRALRTALHFGMPEGRTKTILVTSPSPADGKSTVASNLAISLAQVGRRVLLIDADLRRPVQHEIFGVEDKTGLATLLGHADAPVEGAAQRTVVEGLDVLPCGPVPERPAELLNSQRFIDVLETLAEKYDHVIIDSPPATAVTDARIIGASCDVTLLVLRADNADRRLSETARDGLVSVGAYLLGVVINGVSPGDCLYAGAYQPYPSRGESGAPTAGNGVTHANGNGADESVDSVLVSGAPRTFTIGNGRIHEMVSMLPFERMKVVLDRARTLTNRWRAAGRRR